jgi:ribosomal protein L11 methyltransferase
LEIAIEVAGIDAETIADIFRQACEGGVAIQPSSRLDKPTDTYVLDGDGPALVRGYLRPGPEADRKQDSLQLAVMSAPLTAQARWLAPALLRETSWRDEWKKHFGLQRIGRSIVIRPSWVEYMPREGDAVIEIDPGMAFGTGQHPTTAMCLRALEELVPARASVLDLGCGSGILAIAAAKLGAGRVLALDIDPQAVSAATSNIEANALEGRIEVREGSLGAPGAEERFDLIAANISSLALERLAPAIHAALNAGGHLIASGFLEDAVDRLKQVFADAGLPPERVIEDGVWRTIMARKVDA